MSAYLDALGSPARLVNPSRCRATAARWALAGRCRSSFAAGNACILTKPELDSLLPEVRRLDRILGGLGVAVARKQNR